MKAFDVIFDKPETIFLTVKVKDVLFNGVYIDCNHTDFFAKMACGQMESEKNLRKVEDGGFLFSFFGYVSYRMFFSRLSLSICFGRKTGRSVRG